MLLIFGQPGVKPCIEELPHFMTVAQDMRHKPVKFIFVSLDFAKYKESKLISFYKRKRN